VTTSSVAVGVDEPEGVRRLAPLAAVVSMGAIVVILDGVVVNVALDTMSRQLHASLAAIQWVVTGYSLALATVVPLTGWAAHRLGAKRLWMISLGLFIGGSILCGCSWSIGSLIAFRVVQGLGGGMVIPAGHAIIVGAAGRRRLGSVMSMVNVPLLLGPILGPMLGGALVDLLGWRSIFLVNIPICAATLVLARRIMPVGVVEQGRSLDVRGLLLLSPGLALLLFGLSRAAGPAGLTGASTVVGVALGALLIAAFVVHAARVGSERALIDVSLFARRSFLAPVTIGFLFSFLMSGALILYPLYWQIVRGESALHAGLLVGPQGLGSLITISVIGRLADRYGAARLAPIGLVLALAGTLIYTRVGTQTSYALLAGALFIRGMGLSCLSTPAYAAAYASLTPHEVPRATTAYNIAGRVGGALSVAVVIVVLQRSLARAVPGSAPVSAGRLGALAHRDGLGQSIAHSFGHSFTLLAVITVLAFVPALFLPWRSVQESEAQAG
jgi:EmrB/QacA subfamily drug resistance transporter